MTSRSDDRVDAMSVAFKTMFGNRRKRKRSLRSRWQSFLKRVKDAWLVLNGKEAIHFFPRFDPTPYHVHHNPPPDKVLAVVCRLGAQHEPSEVEIAIRVKGEKFMLKEAFPAARYAPDTDFIKAWARNVWEKMVRECDVRVSLGDQFENMLRNAIENPDPVPISYKLSEMREAGEDV